MIGHLIVGAIMILLFLLVTFLSEGVHFLSGGKISRFIHWDAPVKHGR